MFVLAARVRVLVSDGGCLRVSLVCGPYVARAHGSGGRLRDRTNLGADLRRLHEWWRRQRRSFPACSGSPFVRAGLVSDHRVGRFPSGIYAVTVERISDGFLSWRPLIAGDLPMLAEWLREPQVARWE